MPLPPPRFTPPSSEGQAEGATDRATSPALSSSSRTTTSLPTDLSDVSSLSDGDYEVVDPPRLAAPNARGGGSGSWLDGLPSDSDMEDEQEDRSAQRHRSCSLASTHDSQHSSIIIVPSADADESSQAHSASVAADTDADNPARSNASIFHANDTMDASNGLTASRNSIETLLRSMDEVQEWNNSCASSQLRFPDPLESAYQAEEQMESRQEQDVDESYEEQDDVGQDIDRDEDLARQSLHQSHGVGVYEDGNDAVYDDASKELKKNEEPALSSARESSNMRADIFSHIRALFSLNVGSLSTMRHGWRLGVAVLALAMASSTLKYWPPTPALVPLSQRNTVQLQGPGASTSLMPVKVGPATTFAAVQKPFASGRQSKAVAVVPKSSESKAIRKAKSQRSRPSLQNKTVTTVGRGSREVSVYLAETSTRVSLIKADVYSKMQPGSLACEDYARNVKLRASRRLRRPSRRARKIMKSLQKEWSSIVVQADEHYLKTIDPSVKSLSKDLRNLARVTQSAMVKYEPSKSVERIRDRVLRAWTAVMTLVQKSWAAWRVDIQRAYAKIKREYDAERVRLHSDMDKAWRQASNIALLTSKEASKLWITTQRRATKAASQAYSRNMRKLNILCSCDCTEQRAKMQAEYAREMKVLQRRYRMLVKHIERQSARRAQQKIAARSKVLAVSTLGVISTMQDRMQVAFDGAKTTIIKSALQAGRAKAKLDKAASKAQLCPEWIKAGACPARHAHHKRSSVGSKGKYRNKRPGHRPSWRAAQA